MKVSDVVAILEEFAPVALQEGYDNSGLQIGNLQDTVQGALLTIDVNEAIIDEAIALGANLIIAHHPLIFKSVKRIVSANLVERCIVKAIKNDIAILVAHTNIDSVSEGVSNTIAQKIGLKNQRILVPKKDMLRKLVTFVPNNHLDAVRDAVYNAGAGNIGNYSNCGFILNGEGSFKANDLANPYVGEKNKMHFEQEVRFETVFPFYCESSVLAALKASHPYEEVAYDIYQLSNRWENVGYGIVGELDCAVDLNVFLNRIKEIFQTSSVRYTEGASSIVRKVAVCGGSGSEFVEQAIRSGADVYISADFKYHQFFDVQNRISVVDIGHYESEQFTKELFFEILTKKISTFALHKSSINTNPIKCL